MNILLFWKHKMLSIVLYVLVLIGPVSFAPVKSATDDLDSYVRFLQEGCRRSRMIPTIYFPNSSEHKIIYDSHVAQIEFTARIWKTDGGYILLEGHSSQEEVVGSQSVDIDRVNSVKDFLVGLGIPAGRIWTRVYGASRPLAPGATGESAFGNRRVELTPTHWGEHCRQITNNFIVNWYMKNCSGNRLERSAERCDHAIGLLLLD